MPKGSGNTAQRRLRFSAREAFSLTFNTVFVRASPEQHVREGKGRMWPRLLYPALSTDDG